MLRTTRALAVIAIAALMALGCKKKEDAPPGASSASPVTSTSAPTTPAADGPAVTFAGTYKKFAEDTMKNGQRVHSSSNDGNISIVIDKGVVTWLQSYKDHGTSVHANQIYTFGASDVKTISNGFHVALIWKSLDTDDKHYNPDKNDVQLEAHKTAGGWDIALSTTDTNGVISGVEFR